VTVAQALYWFDPAAFAQEARRLLRPRGVVAAWCYDLFTCAQEVDAVIRTFHDDVVGEFWPQESHHLDAGYQTLPFPFEPVAAPEFSMQDSWTLERVLGYLDTWSAVQRFRAARGTDPLESLRTDLQRVFGAAGESRRLSWKLSLRIGRGA
ncbi:MAG TPA: SAM-dependent methyltransferase, partial [Planctomycetota bacterium]